MAFLSVLPPVFFSFPVFCPPPFRFSPTFFHLSICPCSSFPSFLLLFFYFLSSVLLLSLSLPISSICPCSLPSVLFSRPSFICRRLLFLLLTYSLSPFFSPAVIIAISFSIPPVFAFLFQFVVFSPFLFVVCLLYHHLLPSLHLSPS